MVVIKLAASYFGIKCGDGGCRILYSSIEVRNLTDRLIDIWNIPVLFSVRDLGTILRLIVFSVAVTHYLNTCNLRSLSRCLSVHLW
jgi:hypothetical protein